ncbi:hypothetical protein A2U01_0111935, partial [Trifolium medium]|nr:hypothetical protein [Trifolium medium]
LPSSLVTAVPQLPSVVVVVVSSQSLVTALLPRPAFPSATHRRNTVKQSLSCS